MKILVVVGHPDPSSFNHALAKVVCDECKTLGHEVTFTDLYAQGFDPCLTAGELPRETTLDQTTQNHCNDLVEADGIVIVHPNWWGSPPAAVKGWIDRIFRPDIAYRFDEGDSGEGVPVGLLKATKALVLNTANTSEKRETEIFNDPLELIWKRCVFDLCGVSDVTRKTFSIVVTSTPQIRAGWLEEARQLVRASF